MRWSCGILIMHCFVHLHGAFKVHCRRSWHFFPALPLDPDLFLHHPLLIAAAPANQWVHLAGLPNKNGRNGPPLRGAGGVSTICAAVCNNSPTTCRLHPFGPRSTFPQSLWGCVTCFTIEVGNSSSNSKTKNITNYTHQEGNIMELLLTRHCFHDV